MVKPKFSSLKVRQNQILRTKSNSILQLQEGKTEPVTQNFKFNLNMTKHILASWQGQAQVLQPQGKTEPVTQN